MQNFRERHKSANSLPSTKGVRNIIAIGSGKGGVGKSTVTLYLALTLARLGIKTGVLDADIYGPSLPYLLGVSDTRPVIHPDKTIEPIIAHGLQTMSIGYLVNSETPTVWRGPMISGALNQLLTQTKWRDLDVLLLDLPPGTGDIQLTLGQKVPIVGAVAVTTPQDIAVLDVSKAIATFAKLKIPLLGVVENMTGLFSGQGGHKLADFHNTSVLGRIPFVPSISSEPISDDLSLPPEFEQLALFLNNQLSTIPIDRKIKLQTEVIANA